MGANMSILGIVALCIIGYVIFVVLFYFVIWLLHRLGKIKLFGDEK
jgi:hypothetical protein